MEIYKSHFYLIMDCYSNIHNRIVLNFYKFEIILFFLLNVRKMFFIPLNLLYLIRLIYLDKFMGKIAIDSEFLKFTANIFLTSL